MKYLILSFCLISFSALAQEKLTLDSLSKKYQLTGINNSELNKDKLFKNAQTWVAKTFGDYKAVIQFEDKEVGKLIIKGKNRITTIFDDLGHLTYLKYTVTIDCRDKKYRYTITDVIEENMGGDYEVELFYGKESSVKDDIIQLEKKKSTLTKRKDIEKNDEEILRAKAVLASHNNSLKQIIQITKGIEASIKQAMLVNDEF